MGGSSWAGQGQGAGRAARAGQGMEPQGQAAAATSRGIADGQGGCRLQDREAGMSRQEEGGRGSSRPREFIPLLSAATEELLGLQRRTGGMPEAIAAQIDARLDECAAARLPEGFHAGLRLVVLLRLRDLHRYVEMDPDLRPLKLAVLDAVLRERSPAGRWEAARTLILGRLPALLDVPPAQMGESLKRELSEPAGRLGRLLRLCALLQLEAAGELPPPNLVLRFLRGRFPEHVWEPHRSARGGSLTGAMWQPASPLARWEYLAADLAEHVFRTLAPIGKPAWEGGTARPGRSRTEAPAPVIGEWDEQFRIEQVYCSLEFADSAPEQLPLLPVQPDTFLADMLRHVSGRLGAEGVRQAALLLAACAGCAPGAPVTVDLPALATACGAATRRDAREQARRFVEVVRLLGEVIVQRVSDALPGEAGSGRVRGTRLITVLGWETAAGRVVHGTAGAGSPNQERLTLLAERLLWNEAGRGLGEPFRDLAAEVLALPPREHPCALALAALLRQRFRERPGEPVLHSAAGLMHDAGLVVPESGRLRAFDALKRDLQRLQELGVLGRWRLVRESGVPFPTLRIESPGRRHSAVAPGRTRWTHAAGRAQCALS